MSCVRTRRLFMALWPSPAVCDALAHYTAGLSLPPGARRVVADEWHVTLEFLGVVPESARPSLECLLAEFPAQPEPLVLDNPAYWPESGVGVLVASEVPAPLREGQAWLRERLKQLGHRVDSRPFLPHVTLYRSGLPAAVLPPDPAIGWPLGRVALVESSPVVGSPRYLELAAQELI